MWAKAVALTAVLYNSHGMRVGKEVSFLEDSLYVGDFPVMPVRCEDFNPIGEGTIHGAHSFVIDIFGSDSRIKVNRLRQLSIKRRFPGNYNKEERFPNPHHTFEDNPVPRKRIPDEQKNHVKADLANINFIICPFLSAMVAEGAVPLKQMYHKEDLREATILAGMDEESANMHMDGNFLNNPSLMQDIWNMEGATNEHVTSTGIHDCGTRFSDCKGEPGEASCTASTVRNCDMPNKKIFNLFVESVDVDEDGYITKAELEAAAARAESRGFIVNVPH